MSYPITVHGKPLKKDECVHLSMFLLQSARLLNRRKITFLYRGETLENLCSRLNVIFPFQNNGRKEFFERLFMLGDKARHFHSEKISDICPRSTYMSIEDADEPVFARIFDYLNSSTKSKNVFHIAFFERNSNFKAYFSDKKNKALFLLTTNMLDRDQARAARNYYYILLHQLGAVNYKPKSHIISTSTDYHVAAKFAGVSKNRIVIHAWTPSSKMIGNFVGNKLPMYAGVPYRWQMEYSAVAGILPHYILGLEVLETQKLIINPNLFLSPISEDVFREGIYIDQSRFGDVLNQSNYKRGYVDLGGKLYEL